MFHTVTCLIEIWRRPCRCAWSRHVTIRAHAAWTDMFLQGVGMNEMVKGHAVIARMWARLNMWRDVVVLQSLVARLIAGSDDPQ